MRKLFIAIMSFILVTVPVFAQPEYHVASAAALDYPTDILELLSYRSAAPSTFPEGELIAQTKTVQRVSASDATGFKAVLLNLLGDYETVITDYTYQSSNGYTSHSIQIERDWSWICSAAVLGLVLFCVFRIIGSMLSR